jgi:serine/threonine protein phosphatase PrpC
MPFVQRTSGAMYSGPNKDQSQDRALDWTSANMTIHVFGMYDGHGEYGQVSSKVAASYLKRWIQLHSQVFGDWDPEEWVRQLTAIFPRIHEEIRITLPTAVLLDGKKCYTDGKGVIRYSETNDVVSSGTTALITVSSRDPKTQERFLVTVYVGDSDAYLVMANGTPFKLTSMSQKPSNPDEYARIRALDVSQPNFVYKAKNGSVDIYRADGTLDTHVKENPAAYGVSACNVQGDLSEYLSFVDTDHTVYSLAMTRSLGDFFAHTHGVSCEPVHTIARFGKEHVDMTLVTATDGLWDVLTPTEVAAIINMNRVHGTAPAFLAPAIASHCLPRAKALYLGGYDDMTVLAVALPNPDDDDEATCRQALQSVKSLP